MVKAIKVAAAVGLGAVSGLLVGGAILAVCPNLVAVAVVTGTVVAVGNAVLNADLFCDD